MCLFFYDGNDAQRCVRMTRHTLITWSETKGKNLTVSGVYAEFNKMYNRLSSADGRLLDGDKVLLFLKAVDNERSGRVGQPFGR